MDPEGSHLPADGELFHAEDSVHASTCKSEAQQALVVMAASRKPCRQETALSTLAGVCPDRF